MARVWGLIFAADGDRSVRGDVQSVLRSKVMRVLIDCLRTVSQDTYRGVCRLSYFPYDVEPYFVSTAMAERRKQQGKRDGVLHRSSGHDGVTSLYGHRSISLRLFATSRRPFPARRAMCLIDLLAIYNCHSFVQ